MAKRSPCFSFSIILLLLVLCWPGFEAFAQDNQQEEIKIENAKTDSALVYSYLEIAEEAKREGETRRQRDILSEAQRVADSISDSDLLQVVEKFFGEYYLEAGSYDSARVVLEQAAERSSIDKKVQSQVLNLLATAYRYQSKYPEAMNTYNRGLSLIDSLENPKIYAAINSNKATIYQNLGNRSEAISLYHKGIRFAETVGDSSFLATALNNLGNLYFEDKNFEDALTYLEESVTVSEKQGFHNTLLMAKHNLASTQRDLGNYDEARNLYREAWEIHDKIRPDNPPIQLLHNMGMFHLKKSELDEAEEHFQESLEYSQKASVPAGLFHNFVGLGDVAAARGEYSASTNFYNDAFEIAEKVDSPPFRISAAEKLYEVYKEEGNFEQALKYHELAKQVSDRLTEVQKDEQLALAETELGLRQQQKINQLLQEKQAQQQARITAQSWLIGMSTLVIAIILILIFVLYRSNRERKRVNRELEELNKVKDKMMAIIAHDLRSPMASMKGVLYLLKDEDLEVDEVREIALELEMSIMENITMMDNLLSWAHSQMSGLEIELEILNAHELVEDVLENCSLQAEHKSISLSNEIEPNLKVKADSNLLQLVIRNLVNNAIKFSKEGDAVTVMAEEQSNMITFKVKDTGIGIPKKQQSDIFLLQGNSRPGTNDETGSGLGLQLCKEFVEEQNGTIDLESTEGEGTTFYVTLPKG
ncbi:hypothetical protein CK503_07855 [Aliifodinibius salipaludis]|uniref:histidine kinase n=1 Tax=Fodinibius salipaludis TaxID=2032627 RepID=A0A2A2G9Y3_9BACT|nr:tetratricopeptide repeat protein [Aliifodinibius salipaludis]PAU94118.1 hypothetical protein CK503_07855 [Aliifodinibius salipaludis]